MSVRLTASTSGYTELDAPAVAGNNTIKMPASNGAANQLLKNGGTAGELTYSQATEDSSGNFAFNSGYGSVAPVYGCRAWVNFDGTKDTTGAVSTANTNRLIRASGNVASVLRNGTGDYTITFTTAMPDANYSVSTSSNAGNTFVNNHIGPIAYNTSNVKIVCQTYTGTGADQPFINVAIFR